MGVTREQWLAQQKVLDTPHREAVQYHLKAQAQVGRSAQTVVDHPGWQTFLDHLQPYRDRVAENRDALKQQMSNGDDLGDALTKLKLAHRDLDGEVRGLDVALRLIPELITNGTQATEILDAEGKISLDAS